MMVYVVGIPQSENFWSIYQYAGKKKKSPNVTIKIVIHHLQVGLPVLFCKVSRCTIAFSVAAFAMKCDFDFFYFFFLVCREFA